ncbi:MAG: phage major tail protein, TP901-1 family [Pseudomonadota bacterium]
MGAQKGRDLLLKIDIDGAGTFETVAGLRARSIALNAETVDVTHQESAGQWRELLSGASAKTARLSGSGIFKDAASDERMRALVFSGDIPAFQVVVPDFGTLEGPFQITAFELSGRHDGELAFEVAMESAGQLTFTAA